MHSIQQRTILLFTSIKLCIYIIHFLFIINRKNTVFFKYVIFFCIIIYFLGLNSTCIGWMAKVMKAKVDHLENGSRFHWRMKRRI